MFRQVTNLHLRELQHVAPSVLLAQRTQQWKEDCRRRPIRHLHVQLAWLIQSILQGQTAWQAEFKGHVRKLMEGQLWLLQVDCKTAGELHDRITASLQQPPPGFEGVFVVNNICQAERQATELAMHRLLDNAHLIVDVEVTQQNFNAAEGKQLSDPEVANLKSILTDLTIQSDAMADLIAPNMGALQELCLPFSPPPDFISAVLGYMVRDFHATQLLSSKFTTRVKYVPSLDTVTSASLRAALHDGLSIPGIAQVTPAIAERISQCFQTSADGSVSFVNAGLSDIARGMPASSLWAQTLLDLLHAVARHRLVLSGINTPTLILSQFLSSTLQHHEDLGAGALNLLVAGSPKLWASLSAAAEYDALLEADGASPSGSRDKKLIRSFSSMNGVQVDSISMLLQYSGQCVYTVAGHHWHQTLSVGTSVAESMNHWCGLEPFSPHRSPAVASIASDLLALATQPVAVRSGWPVSYRHMAQAYFPQW